MRSDRLFSRDFTLMILGQIISLFGNAILRFALSLYVLDTTGSAAAFGGILAVSMVPTIDRKSTRLNSSHITRSRMPSSA